MGFFSATKRAAALLGLAAVFMMTGAADAAKQDVPEMRDKWQQQRRMKEQQKNTAKNKPIVPLTFMNAAAPMSAAVSYDNIGYSQIIPTDGVPVGGGTLSELMMRPYNDHTVTAAGLSFSAEAGKTYQITVKYESDTYVGIDAMCDILTDNFTGDYKTDRITYYSNWDYETVTINRFFTSSVDGMLRILLWDRSANELSYTIAIEESNIPSYTTLDYSSKTITVGGAAVSGNLSEQAIVYGDLYNVAGLGFQATAGKVYQITAKFESNTDVTMNPIWAIFKSGTLTGDQDDIIAADGFSSVYGSEVTLNGYFTSQETGRLRVLLLDEELNELDYSVSIQEVNVSSYTTLSYSTKVPVNGTPVTGTLPSGLVEDWCNNFGTAKDLSFDAKAGKKYQITVKFESVENIDMNVRFNVLYKDLSDRHCGSWNSNYGKELTLNRVFTSDEDGLFPILLFDFNGNELDYTIEITEIVPPTPIPLTANVWMDGEITYVGEEVLYSFPVVAGTTYYVWWNDSHRGDGSKDLDVRVRAKYSGDDPTYFFEEDSGWDSPRSFVASINGTVIIEVTDWYSSSAGTFAVLYNTTGVKPAKAETPIIYWHPENGTYMAGDGIWTDGDGTLTVMAYVSDDGDLSFQWYRNAANNNSGGTLIPGATSETYDIPVSTITAGTHYYYAIVTNTNTDIPTGPNRTATAVSSVAAITINKLTGSGSVTLENWTSGEAHKNPVPVSATNGIASVTYHYKLQSAADAAYTTARPTAPGNYTIRATFAQTAVYLAVTATYNFTINPGVESAVTVTSAGTGTAGNGNYIAGVTVSINAGTAPEGKQFKNWTTSSAGVTFANANSAATTFIMPPNAVTVTANFEDALSVVQNNREIPQLKTEASVSQLSSEFTAGPNPVAKSAGKVDLFWQGKRIQSAALTIFDASGNVVSKAAIRDNANGNDYSRRIVGSWDLKDAKGRQVSEGTYLVRGVITIDGKKERVSVMVGVR